LWRSASDRHYVLISRFCTVLLVIASAWVSVQLGSIASGWQVVLQIGAGTGAVYILRWYWWRINAWSEISAMACSLLVTVILNRWQPFTGNSSLVFAKSVITTTVITTIVWLTVTMLTKPEPEEILLRFYRKVRPDIRGWKRIASRAPELKPHHDLGSNLGAWALGCAMIYLCLFGTGKLLLHQAAIGIMMLAGSAVCAFLLYRGVVQNFKVEPLEE
jgi:solute:Na+ symporter, SSS family